MLRVCGNKKEEMKQEEATNHIPLKSFSPNFKFFLLISDERRESKWRERIIMACNYRLYFHFVESPCRYIWTQHRERELRVKEKKASIDEIFYSTIFLNIKFLVVILRIILLPHDYEELPGFFEFPSLF